MRPKSIPPYSEWVQRLFVLTLIAGAATWLYFPYLNNPLVFDDSNIFHTSVLTTAAIAPWEIGIRGLPYFTLGWVETQIGSIVAHRSVSLLLHILVSYQMFRFLEEVLATTPNTLSSDQPEWTRRNRWIAGIVALTFVVHPVAVYGAGYLVQRTIVFSTLFALLCLRHFMKAVQKDSLDLAARAAILASLAILSKQHAVLVPVAALSLLLLLDRPWRLQLRIGAVFMGLSLPAILLATHANLSVVGQVYEPAMNEIESERFALPAFSNSFERWLLSAATQARLYFEYWRQWLWPDPDHMSVDLRVDFLRPWTEIGAVAWIGLFMAIPLVAVYLGAKWKPGRLAACAISLTTILFAIELATVRFQEPFVLYRSYLWSIGYCVFAAAVLRGLPARLVVAFGALVVPLLVFQATGRLDSFRSKLALWEDAAAKLPKREIAGSSRIMFNRGGERFRAGDLDGAMSDINEAIRLNPVNGRYRNARAIALLKSGRTQDALDEVGAALDRIPDNADFLFTRAQALRALGRAEEADAALTEAARRGSFSAKYQIAGRRNPSGDVTVDFSQPP